MYGSAWFGSVWGGFLGGILGGIARAGFPTERVLSQTPLIIRAVDASGSKKLVLRFALLGRDGAQTGLLAFSFFIFMRCFMRAACC